MINVAYGQISSIVIRRTCLSIEKFKHLETKMKFESGGFYDLQPAMLDSRSQTADTAAVI